MGHEATQSFRQLSESAFVTGQDPCECSRETEGRFDGFCAPGKGHVADSYTVHWHLLGDLAALCLRVRARVCQSLDKVASFSSRAAARGFNH